MSYKIEVVHEQEPHDKLQLHALVQWCMEKYLLNAIFSGECFFSWVYFSRFWNFGHAEHSNLELRKTKKIQEQKPHSKSISVLYAIDANRFLDAYNFLTKTVRGDDYFQTLITYVRPEAAMIPQNLLFSQDGALLHAVLEIPSLLNVLIPNLWIDRGGPRKWPARSPDLALPNFLPWRLVKLVNFEIHVSNRKQLIRKNDSNQSCHLQNAQQCLKKV